MFKMIVAHTRGRGIGFRGKLPWKLPDDMARIKRLTIGDGNNAVVMGKKTWLSLSKRPLPERHNLILSQSLSFDYNKSYNKNLKHPDVKTFSGIPDLRNFCRESGFDDVWVIGGGDIYSEFLAPGGNINSIYATEIDSDYNCDAHFPEIPPLFSPIWKSNSKEENDIKYSYVVYKRLL